MEESHHVVPQTVAQRYAEFRSTIVIDTEKAGVFWSNAIDAQKRVKVEPEATDEKLKTRAAHHNETKGSYKRRKEW